MANQSLSTAKISPLRLPGRIQLAVAFLLEQIDEWGEVVAEELTLSEDVGLDGAHLRSRRDFGRGTLLTVREPGGAYEAAAKVVDSDALPGGIRRLDVLFLGQGPAHLLHDPGAR